MKTKEYKTLKANLIGLGFKTYKEYLKSDNWKEKKQYSYDHNLRSCFICGSKDNIHLHHLTYKKMRKRKVGNCIRPVCAEHHLQIHKHAEKHNVSIWTATFNIAHHYWKTIGKPESEIKKLFKGKRKIDKRVGSMTIMPTSGLPTTLHLSIASSVTYIKKSNTYKDFINLWLEKKFNKSDEVMLSLYNANYEKADRFFSHLFNKLK